jgi:hypothetical protein
MKQSYRNELPEPLRSLIEDMARKPVPEPLLHRAPPFAVPVARKENSRRSGLAIVASGLALCLCIAALIFDKFPPEPLPRITQNTSTAPPIQHTEIPPPSLWAYRQAASSPESLDALLTQHAAVLLQPGPWEDPRPFRYSFGKEEP